MTTIMMIMIMIMMMMVVVLVRRILFGRRCSND